MGCSWHVNLTFPKKTAVISITSVELSHNHPPNPKVNQYATKNRTLPEAVIQDIRFYTVEGNLSSTIQRRLLSAKYPNITIHPRDIQNIIQKYKVDRIEENDAANLLRQLLTKKAEESGWEVFWELHNQTNSLNKLFWMSPEQVQRWITYHDVILNDNTHRTNQFNMPLSLFVAVDNHFRTRLVAQALVCDETKDTYEWILTSTLKATGHAPRVFITDSDPAMDVAIDNQYSDSYSLHCLYHISQNLIRNLKAPLSNTFNDFLKEFFICRNTLSLAEFEIKWHKLIEKYPNSANYLNSELYSSKEKWAKAYTAKFFTAGISTTSRVESENSVIKNVLQARPSLCDLAVILDQRLCDEAQYINHSEWYHTNASAQLTGASAECFPEIDLILKEYLTEEMLSRQRHEIIQSLYYCAKVESEQLLSNESVEEEYDSRQIHLTSLLEDIPQNKIINIYSVRRRNCKHNNFVVILSDRAHLCTCMLLINCGLVCRHFWHIMAIDDTVSFHITMIPRRWYKGEKMEDLSLDEKPYMTNIGSIQHEGYLLCPRLFPMHQIIKIRGDDIFSSEVRCIVQKRRDYGETFSLARKAVRSAVEAGNESISRLKRVLNDWFSEEQRLVHINDDDKENFDLNQVRNPIEKRQKGRPPTKRLKSSIELQTKGKRPTTQNKCGKCGIVGHYAPTCKN